MPSASADTSRTLSFQEIDQERKAITGGSEVPSVDQIRKLDEYDHSLEGKQISGWRGWVVETSPDKYMLDKDPGFQPTEFSVIITMDSSRIQTPRNKQLVLIDNGVMLDGVPRYQVEQLHVWSDIGTAEWQEIEFSATIDGVLPTAGLALILTNGRIKPLP